MLCSEKSNFASQLAQRIFGWLIAQSGKGKEKKLQDYTKFVQEITRFEKY